jgi:hypothetical protein
MWPFRPGLGIGGTEPPPPSLKVCWGPSRERQRGMGLWASPQGLFGPINFLLHWVWPQSFGQPQVSLSIRNTLNHHEIKHLQTPQALKPRSGELVIAQMKCRKRQRVPILVLLCGSNDVGGKLCSHDERAGGAQRRGWASRCVADIGDHWHCAA